jgi:hypothetical protein
LRRMTSPIYTSVSLIVDYEQQQKQQQLLYLKLLNEGGLCCRGVDEHDPEAPGRVHRGKAGKDVGAGAVAQTNHHLHAKVVQDVYKVLANLEGEKGGII